MKLKDIRDLSPNELTARRRELKTELFHLRLQKQGGQLENPSLLRSLRREVARVETILNQKSAAAAAAK